MIRCYSSKNEDKGKISRKVGFVLELFLAMTVTSCGYSFFLDVIELFPECFSPVSGLLELLAYVALLFVLGYWVKRITRECKGIYPNNVIQVILLVHLLFISGYFIGAAAIDSSLSFSKAFPFLILNVGFVVPLAKLWEVNSIADVCEIIGEAYCADGFKKEDWHILILVDLALTVIMWIFTACRYLIFGIVGVEFIVVFGLDWLRKRRITKFIDLVNEKNKEDGAILIWSSDKEHILYRNLLSKNSITEESGDVCSAPEKYFQYIVVIGCTTHKQNNSHQRNILANLLCSGGIIIDPGYTKKDHRSMLFDWFGIPTRIPKEFTFAEYSNKLS